MERLRSSFALVDPPQARVSVSIGAVAFLAAPETVEQMVQRADAKMYEAKATGRNCVQLETVNEVNAA